MRENCTSALKKSKEERGKRIKFVIMLLYKTKEKLKTEEKWCGIFRLQKSCYIAKTMLGVNLDYKFIPDVHGPYCRQMTDEIDIAHSNGLVSIESSHYKCGDSLKVGNIIKDDIERTADSYERKDEIAFIADWFSAKTALEIEKITTVYMIKKELCLDKGRARQIKFMQTWKPHFSKKDFDKAAADIKEWEGKAKAQKLIS